MTFSAFAEFPCRPKNNREAELLDLGYGDLSPRLIKLIEQGVNPDVCDYQGSTILSLATFWNQPRLVAYLVLYSSADVNYVDKYGWSALPGAVSRGYPHILKILLQAPRLKFDQEIPRGQNILHIFAYNDRMPDEIIKELGRLLLGRATAKMMNQKNARQYTPLHFAIRRDNRLIVKLFLESKLVDMNILSPEGKDYLDFARAENRPEIVEILSQSK